MHKSESFLLFVLCGEFPSPTARTSLPITGRQWQTLCRILSAEGLSVQDLWTDEGLATAMLAGEPVYQRIVHRLHEADAAAAEWERLSSLGVRVVTWADDDYPAALRERLERQAPPVLYLSGEMPTGKAAIGVVGSRDADEQSLRFAALLGTRCAVESLTLVSGGAVGVDTAAVDAALAHGGQALICCANGLLQRQEQTARDFPEAVNRVVWLSASHPDAAFASFRALERNRFIYSLSTYAVVVSAGAQKGGTWSGATDDLRHGWCPLFVLDGSHVRDGNRLLLSRADVAPLSPVDLAGGDEPLLDRLAARHPLMQYEQLHLF